MSTNHPSCTRRAAIAAAAGSSLGLAVMPGRAFVQDDAPGFDLEMGVVYGEIDGKKLLADIRRPTGADTPAHAVILIHGGGWTTQTSGPDAMIAPAELLPQEGFVTFTISYRLTNDPAGPSQWPDQLDDVQRAVRWVRANASQYGVNPDRVSAVGYSAGGHLAALLAVRETRDDAIPELAGMSSRVNAAVVVAGHLDLTIASPQEWVNDLVVLLLGGTADEEPERWLDASPIEWVDAESAPMMLIHGTLDDVNPIEHATRMADALADAGANVVLEEMADHDHTSIEDWYTIVPLIVPFLSLEVG